jgi:hypothetical protein
MLTIYIIINTLQPYREVKSLRNMLPRYALHIRNGPSCLMTILGLYRVQCVRRGQCKYVMICSNILPVHAACETVYDLKGSMVGRVASNRSKVLTFHISNCTILANI